MTKAVSALDARLFRRAGGMASGVLLLLFLTWGSGAEAGPGVRTEGFDKSQPDGWELVGDVRVGMLEGRSVLSADGFGLGVWSGGAAEDFALSLRYRHGTGVGLVALSLSGDVASRALYGLTLWGDSVRLAREQKGVKNELGSAAHVFRTGQWYRLRVERSGAGLRVAVDGRPVLSVSDPAPLPAGGLGLGALLGRGFAYDDVALQEHGAGAAPLDLADVEVTGALQRAGISAADQLVTRLRSRADVAALSRAVGVPAEQLLVAALEADLASTLEPAGVTRTQLKLLARAGFERPEDLAAARGGAARLHALLGSHARRYHIPAPSPELVSKWVSLAAERPSRLPPTKDLATVKAALDPRLFLRQNSALPGDPDWIRSVLGQLPRPQMLTGIGVVSGEGEVIKLPKAAQAKPFTYEFKATESGLYRVDLSLTRLGGIATLRWFIDAPRVVLHLPESGSTAGTLVGQGHAWDPVPAKTTVRGFAPLIAGADTIVTGRPKRVGRTCLYFWIAPASVPLNGLLRLRLEVASNADTGVEDGIEQTHAGKSDPTIHGVVQVTRQPAQHLALNEATTFAMTGGLDVAAGDFPLQLVRMAYQPAIAVRGYWVTRAGQACTIKQEGSVVELEIPGASTKAVDLRLAGTELIGAWQYGAGPPEQVTGWISENLTSDGQAQEITWSNGVIMGRAAAAPVGGLAPWQIALSAVGDDGSTLFPQDVARDGVRVGSLEPAGTYVISAPRAGTYTMLVPTGTLRELASQGASFNVSSAIPRPYRNVTVSARHSGGTPPVHHVVELLEVAVSGQEEPNSDDNDKGPGEFQVRATNLLLNPPGRKKTEAEAIDAVLKGAWEFNRTTSVWPAWPGSWGRIPERKGATPDSTRHVTHPRSLVGVWDVEELAKYESMAISLVVLEDDEEDWLKSQMKMLAFAKNIMALFQGFFKGDFKAIGEAFYKHVKLAREDYSPDATDDIMGYLGYGSYKVRGFGLPGPEQYVKPKDYKAWNIFQLSGCSNPTDRTFLDDAHGAGIDLAFVTVRGTGSRWASAQLLHKRVQALYARVGVQVTGFTVDQPVDEGEEWKSDPLIPLPPIGWRPWTALREMSGAPEPKKAGPDPADVYFTLAPPVERPNAWLDVQTYIKEEQRRDAEKKSKIGVAINRNDYVFVDQIYTAPIGQPVMIRTGGRPFTVDMPGYDPLSCFSIEAAFYDEDPGDDQLIGRFTRTLYLEDFIKNLGKKGDFQPADPTRTRVNYYRDGPYIIGDFIIVKPGGALGELRLRVWVRIWEG